MIGEVEGIQTSSYNQPKIREPWPNREREAERYDDAEVINQT
jgi:hypothetical protein